MLLNAVFGQALLFLFLRKARKNAIFALSNQSISTNMKKLTYLLLITLAVIIAGCGPQNTNTTDNAAKDTEIAVEDTSSAQNDLFYVESGDLYFYDLQSNKATHYANETDSVVRADLSKNNVLYYTVAKDGNLLLRSLDLKVANPMPETLADWDVPVEGRTEMDGFGDMYLNYEETQVALERDVRWFTGLFYNLAVYDLAAKTVTVYPLYREVFDGDEFMYFEDLPDNSGFNRWGPSDAPYSTTDERLENVANDIYYVGGGLRVCLTDRIDIDAIYDFGLDKEEYEVDASMDPTGKRALIGYNVGMGDGTLGAYFVSSIDGQQQLMLPGSDYETSNPTWLSDGSLLYVGYDDGEGLYLLDLEGNIRKIAESEIYGVLH